MSNFLLKQDGDYLLIQSGDKLLLQEGALPPIVILPPGEVLNDAKYRALRALGYDAPLPEMESAWLLANGASSVKPLPEMWSEMLQSKGYGYPYSINKAWELVLKDEGYDAPLPEMERQFWIDGGTFS